jgi:hypothetical protein
MVVTALGKTIISWRRFLSKRRGLLFFGNYNSSQVIILSKIKVDKVFIFCIERILLSISQINSLERTKYALGIMKIITHEIKSADRSNVMRAPLTNHDGFSEPMLFGLQPHSLYDIPLLSDSKLKLSLHFFDQIIIEKDFLLEFLN